MRFKSCGTLIQEQVEELHHGGVGSLLKDIDTTVNRNPLAILPVPGSQQTQYSSYGSRLGYLNILLHAKHYITPGIPRSQGGSWKPEDQALGVPLSHPRICGPVRPRTQGEPSNLTPTNSCLSSSSATEPLIPQSSAKPSSSITLTERYEWVHLCIENRIGILHLQSIDVRPFLTDGPLFTAIHEAYFGKSFTLRVRGIISLRVLTGVRCIHVSSRP